MSTENSHRGPVAWMAENAVASNLLMIVFLIGGLIMAMNIRQEVFPDMDFDAVTVSVSYPGASPEEIERGIILPIEEAVQGIEGIDEMVSNAREGAGTVSLQALDGADIMQLYQDIKTEVDRITTFPDDAETPSVVVNARKREVLSLAVYGDASERSLRETADSLRDMILLDPGITQVELDGVRDYEIAVSVSQDTLRRYGVSMADIAGRIRSVAIELPGGSMKTVGGEILIRMNERREMAREFEKLPILTAADGTRILLGDIATVEETFEDTTRYSTYNGKRTVMVDVYRVGDQKPIEVSDATLATIAGFRESLPHGVDVAVVRDLSEVFRERADLLLRNGYLGLVLVFVFLAMFLEIRLAFWVSLGIPISFLGAFILFPATDFSVNMITMFAFIMTLGIVVDDAIVVGENIHYNREAGMSALEAAVQGAKEIVMPVTFSVLTNIVTFMPLYFVPGFMGRIFKFIPVVVAVVFLISLVESLLILPAHLGHQKTLNPHGLLARLEAPQRWFSTSFSRWVALYYGPVLRFCLKNRYAVLATGLAMLIISVSFIRSGRMGLVLMPRVESDYAYGTAVLPYGSADEKVAAMADRMVKGAQKVIAANGGDTLAKGIYTRVSENEITMRVYLTAYEIRPVTTVNFVNLWRKEVGTVPGLESLQFQADRGGPGGGSKGLTVQLAHRNIDTLTGASEKLAERLTAYPQVKDADDGSAQGKAQIDFNMRPEGERLGFTAESVARQIRNAYYGSEALRFLRGKDEVTVRIRLPEEERMSESAMDDMIIFTDAGVEAPLREVVTMTKGRAFRSIERRQGRRTNLVTADVEPPEQAEWIVKDLQKTVLPVLAEEFPGLSFSFEGSQADMRESVDSLMQNLMLALLVIFAMLAIPFKSYFQPLIIMIAIPFGMVGALLGHILMGYSLSIMSLFGIVALSGVVVNDSLVMIDFANRRKRSGLPAFRAILDSGIHRFRPIMLTTLTTFGGLAPMIFETSRQARFLIPMAISLGYGILFATFITLVLVPALYLAFEDIGAGWRWVWHEPIEDIGPEGENGEPVS